MTSQAIPQNDKALLAAQAKAGQAGVDAYQAAKTEMAADQQQVLQHATQAAQARGGPAQATELATSQANDAYNKGQAQLSRGQANTAARSAGRQESMNLYNQMVLGSRSLIEDQADAAALMINTQSEADVAGIRRQGESNVHSINSQMELEAAQFEQAMRQAEKDAELEESRWQREMEQRERLARMSASGGGGGGAESRSATQAEIKAALSQGGIQRLNEVAGSLGARVDSANLTDETYEALYTGSLMQQNKYEDAALDLFAPLLANGMSERDVAVIAQGWADNGKIDETDLRSLAQHSYDIENPTPIWMDDPRARSEYGNLSVTGANDLQPYVQDAHNQINKLLANLQNEATALINTGLEGANAGGVQITKDDLDFGNLRRALPMTGEMQGRTNRSTDAAGSRYTALANSMGANLGPGGNSMSIPPRDYADLDQAGKYQVWGNGNNAWAGDFSFDPNTGEQDRLNRELEYSTRDLYENDESMRPFLDGLMGQSRSFDGIANEQGLSESRMIEQILGMRAPDEFNLDDYSQNANGEEIYKQFLRANPGMADGSGAEVARQMFQEAMSSADPAYWDALNVSQENLAPYMMMGRQELNDHNFMDAAGTNGNKSLSELYNPRSYDEMAREQRDINASDNEYFNEQAGSDAQFGPLTESTLNGYVSAAQASNPRFEDMDRAGQTQAVSQAIANDASAQARDLMGTNANEFKALFDSNEQMVAALNADFSDQSQAIRIGVANDEDVKNYIGLNQDVLQRMIDDDTANGTQLINTYTDDETGEYLYETTLSNVLYGLRDTVGTNYNEANSDGGDYVKFLQGLGLTQVSGNAQDRLMYRFMELFSPDRINELSLNSNLPPSAGAGPTIDRDF